MIVEHEDRATDWKDLWFEHPGYDGVRIWERRTPFGMFQRHEWRRPDGSSSLDGWIAVPRREFGKHLRPLAEPAEDHEDRAIDALRQIAAGHNDPRSLAAEVLALIFPGK